MSAQALLAGLGRNLAGGVRLALWPGASWRDFRAGPADYATLVAFNALAWFAAATLRTVGDVQLDASAIAIYLGTVPIVLGCGMLVAYLYGHARLGLLVAVALSASDVVVEVAGLVLVALPLAGLAQKLAFLVFFAWVWAIALRAVAVCTQARGPALWRGAAVVSALGAIMMFGYPRAEPWVTAPGEPAPGPALADEALFHAQGAVVERALDEIAEGRAGTPEFYFVGFAPDGTQESNAREMRKAKAAFESRYAAAGRAIALVSNEASLAEFPIATATNLRRSLATVAERMNADEDVLLLYLSARGDPRFDLAAWLPPLEQAPLNPTALARVLHESGIRWKVVVVSACFAGGFIEPLKDPYTLVIASSPDDRATPGCEGGRDAGGFGEAFFGEGLGATRDLAGAFEHARARIAERAKAAGRAGSDPQLWAGEQIAAKLAVLAAR